MEPPFDFRMYVVRRGYIVLHSVVLIKLCFSDLVPIPGVELAVESTGPRVYDVHSKSRQTAVFWLAGLNVYQPWFLSWLKPARRKRDMICNIQEEEKM